MKTIKQVEAYAKKVIPLLNLSHWKIEFFDKRTGFNEDGIPASCKSQHNYKVAYIYIYNPYDSLLNEKQRKTLIIHELLHCHTSFWRKPIDIFLKDDASTPNNRYTELTNSVQDNEEECVELLARSIYKLVERL